MWRDDAYLLDILNAARRVVRYAEDLSWERFRDDSLMQDAILRNLQIIGEAAQRISPELKSRHPQIPWAPMAGMRNRLVHEYFRLDLERIWQTVREDVPVLMTSIEPLVPPPEVDEP
jgi:uncharacterized protein with HEPN domain